MKPVPFEGSNGILRAPPGREGDVLDLPVMFGYDPSAGVPIVVSVWELTEAEIRAVVLSRRMRFSAYGHTHPPILPMIADESGRAIEFEP